MVGLASRPDPAETPKAVNVRQARETMEPRQTELVCAGPALLREVYGGANVVQRRLNQARLGAAPNVLCPHEWGRVPLVTRRTKHDSTEGTAGFG